MKFPEVPTVHGSDPTPTGKPSEWRASRDGEPFRTCFWCGCIHPEDLLTAIKAGAVVGGSDWKYGWPHKFYVDVVNPDPARLFDVGSETKTFDEPCPTCCGPDGKPRADLMVAEAQACPCRGLFRRTERTTHMGTRETFHAKWYNEHIQDEGFDDEARAALLLALEQTGGIKFELEGGKLKYRAPYHGYQR